MATSDRGGFLQRGGHLVGSGAAVVGLAAGWFAGGPPLVCLGVGAVAYGAGFLLTPRRRPVPTVDDLEVARRDLQEFRRFLDAGARDLGPELLDHVRAVVTVVEEVLSAWAELSPSPAERFSVGSVIADHLPTTLRNHLELPVGLRPRAAVEVHQQLDLLHAELVRIRDLAHRGALQRVEVQGIFLRDRFRP